MQADVQALIAEAQRARLWGQIQIDFQAGQIVTIRKTETIKPTAARTTASDQSTSR